MFWYAFISPNLHKNDLLSDIMQVYSLYYLMDHALLTTHIHFTTLHPTFSKKKMVIIKKLKFMLVMWLKLVLQALEQFSNTTEMTNKFMFLYMWLDLKMFWGEIIYFHVQYTDCKKILMILGIEFILYLQWNLHRHHETSNFEYLRNDFLFSAIW